MITAFDLWGFIPSFLDHNDPRSAREQFNAKYISGWQHFEGFKLEPRSMVLKYPGDPSMKPLGFMTFRTEKIYLYPHAWVLVMQPTGAWEICRMD